MQRPPFQIIHDDVIKMETFSALLALCVGNSPVTGEFPSQRPVTRSFDVFFDLRLNKRLSKHSRRLWFEILICSLWRHCNEGFPWRLNDHVHGQYDVYWFDLKTVVPGRRIRRSWDRHIFITGIPILGRWQNHIRRIPGAFLYLSLIQDCGISNASAMLPTEILQFCTKLST